MVFIKVPEKQPDTRFTALVCGWTDNHLLKIIHLIGGVEEKCKQEHKVKERHNFYILVDSIGL